MKLTATSPISIAVLSSSYLVHLILGGNSAFAQTPDTPDDREPLIFIPRQVSESDDAPGDTRNPYPQPSPGEVNHCENIKEHLQALVPVRVTTVEENSSFSEVRENIIELTLDETPTFWFYIPEQNSLTAEFSLLDENSFELYTSGDLSLPSDRGFVGVTLPNHLGEEELLQVGQDYRWQFDIICNPDRPSLNLKVQGWVRRIEGGEINIDLQEVEDVNVDYTMRRPDILNLAREGMWYDTLTLVGASYYENPSDPEIALDWQTLLEYIGLEEYAEVTVRALYLPESGENEENQ